MPIVQPLALVNITIADLGVGNQQETSSSTCLFVLGLQLLPVGTSTVHGMDGLLFLIVKWPCCLVVILMKPMSLSQ